jgi:hypothetical protein
VEGIKSVLVNLPLYNSLAFIAGSGSVTGVRNSAATYIDRYGVVKTLAANEIGFNANGADLPPESTNLLAYSQDFTNATWGMIGTGSVTTNSIDAPDMTTTADLLDDTSTSRDHTYWDQIIVVADDEPIVRKNFVENYSFEDLLIEYRESESNKIFPKVKVEDVFAKYKFSPEKYKLKLSDINKQEIDKDMVYEKVILATEIKTKNPELLKDIVITTNKSKQEFVTHDELKELTKNCKVVIRTGENTPYANIVLQAGVNFGLEE